ncbi:unnamed protein product [Zymoseptoria tritici ST99CH_1A5]|uniref:Uncharacterized protein n=2 Tax=Zymoseptoria tritici TaxID=1047171 RepID=A0A2H1GJ32_ZYMTR|nr:unnamed protein product [Zymoseptoria tritici ST99CH_1E4]SMR55904.1 unnamed protein product [Zymoseptoria tritici ST99CH_3D1]SMY25094.1 unnamed protein product [Zymoseptoria tritici ST99CH_1A5]
MVNYEDCKLNELKKFVSQGKIFVELPHQKLRKTEKLEMRHHVRALKLADQSPYLPSFIGLAVEVKDLIYEELLGDLDTAASNLGILSVNKEIHREASDVLWRRNTFKITVGNQGIFTHGHRQECFAPLRPSALFKPSWPVFIRKVRTLRIVFAVNTVRCGWPGYARTVHLHSTTRVPAEEQLVLLNHLLFSLSSFLSGSNDLRTVRLDLSLNEKNTWKLHPVVGNLNLLRTCIRPLSMLQMLREISVDGARSTVVNQNAFDPDEAALRPGVILSSWMHIYAAAKYCHNMRRVVHRMSSTFPDSPQWQNLVDISDAYASFNEVLPGDMSPPPWRTDRALSRFSKFVSRDVETALQLHIDEMRAGLRLFRQRPHDIEVLDEQITKASDKLTEGIATNVQFLEDLVGALAALVGTSRTEILHNQVRSLKHEKVNGQGYNWWVDMPTRFRKGIAGLTPALAHPALRKGVALHAHDLSARKTRPTRLVLPPISPQPIGGTRNDQSST